MTSRLIRAMLLVSFLLLLGNAVRTGVSAQNGIDAKLWKISPPSPQIPESERLAELAARRRSVAARMGERGVMVLFSAEPRVYTNDVDYHYRQENNLYYLTGIRQNGAVLVLAPGAKGAKEMLFMPRRDPWFETWNGRMMSFDEARARSGVAAVADAELLPAFLATLAPRASTAIAQRTPVKPASAEQVRLWREDFAPVIETIRANRGELFLLVPSERDSREYRQEQIFAANLAQLSTGLAIRDAAPIFAELRLIKSPWEIKLLQHAVDITSEAFHRVFAFAAPGMYEYEIQAEFEYTFRRRNADNWGYPCIVGGGANATTLHYITSQDRLDDASLLLMDCAAEFDHYTADITRTLPVTGKFTKEQADIYRIVYDAQMAAIDRVRPGNIVGTRRDARLSPDSVHGKTVEVVKEGLFKLGLITSKDNDEYRVWFMHGTSHWLGMNVHDVGDYSTPLAPGMVLTVEPGVYLRPDALDVLPKTPEWERFAAAVRPAFEKYRGIGVRIEDDVLVTEAAPVVMSAAIPSKLEEVEAIMARLKQELRKSGVPSVAFR
ncbi:MAG: aminopeptidase P family protein [Acidobacteria bacterium]|nr:aminopeptidase P family protein [Acidobacteriota bacterium]MCW5968470.1 aminopeptidase P family protein [Blastocatellales bacterium]